jgi:putative transposase
MKIIYKNRLPHIAPVGASFFVTFRLADSLPQQIVAEIKQTLAEKERSLRIQFPKDWYELLRIERKRMFGKYEQQLDANPYGECLLKNTAAAERTAEKLREFDGQYYDLWAYCIMPNHVHVLFDFSRQLMDEQNLPSPDIPEEYKQLDYVMMRIKGGSSYAINYALGRKGTLWAKDSFDHYVRNEPEWFRILNYILHNPVKARLAERWDEYPYTFCRPLP